MKFKHSHTQLFWVFFICLLTLNCTIDYQPRPDFTEPDVSPFANTNELIEFRSGLQVRLKQDTELNRTLLQERDRYATIFTDPYGYLWTISTAYGLTDQDFAAVGSYLSDEMTDGQAFYYGKIRNWEISPDCVVYLSAGQTHFVTLRRNQDQGPCPLGAGYKIWLPEAVAPINDSGVQLAWLWAYGANNHPENIVYGEFKGVAIYGNDPYGQPCGDFQLPSACMTYADNLFTGLKWNSGEFANRFLITTHNHRKLSHDPVKNWYKYAFDYGYFRLPNCGTARPQIGDVLVSDGGSHGHAAVVRDVSDHQLKIIQQNWHESSADNEQILSFTVAGNHFCVEDFGDGYPIQGWLRP